MWIDLAIGVVLFVVMVALEPAMLDGDGLYHSGRAIYEGFLEGMDAKHPLVTVPLRTLALALNTVGLRAYTLQGFLVLMHLCGVGIYLLLARSIFPRFISEPRLARLCALGVVVSFGLLSRSVSVEVYALALLADVALVAYCLWADATKFRTSVLAGVLFVLAVGFHVTNVLLGPFVVALLAARAFQADGRVLKTLVGFGGTVLLGGLAIAALLMLGAGSGLWPPNLQALALEPAHQQQQSLPVRVARGAYGFARTVAFLPYRRDLTPTFAAGYAAAAVAAMALFLFVASRGLFRQLRAHSMLFLMLGLIVVPFAAMGLYYYPSDPERWLFLLPVLWLLVGLAWQEYSANPSPLLSTGGSLALLTGVVVALAVYNTAFGIYPERLDNRGLNGLRALSDLVRPDDLVISPAGIKGQIYEFYLGSPIQAQNLVIVDLVDRYRNDEAGIRSEILGRVGSELDQGHRVFVVGLLGERLIKGEGYPWSNLPDQYGPETFLAMLSEFEALPITQPGPHSTGIYRLLRKQRSSEPVTD